LFQTFSHRYELWIIEFEIALRNSQQNNNVICNVIISYSAQVLIGTLSWLIDVCIVSLFL